MTKSNQISVVRGLMLVASLSLFTSRVEADPYLATSDLTPTPNGRYVLRAGVPVRFADTTYVQDFSWTQLPGPFIHSPQPLPGDEWAIDSFFDITFDLQLGGALGSGGNFGDTPGLNGGDMIGMGSGTSTRTFDTEMLQLNLTGSDGLTNIMIRESPTLASTGQTTIESLPGGIYRIDSFFDIFTELSLDGGQSWIPADGPLHMTSVPEPSGLFLGACGACLLGAWLRRRRS